MTESEVVEARELKRCIRELEDKIGYWKHEQETAAHLVEKLMDRMKTALDRQRELMETKAADA